VVAEQEEERESGRLSAAFDFEESISCIAVSSYDHRHPSVFVRLLHLRLRLACSSFVRSMASETCEDAPDYVRILPCTVKVAEW
jgi:hypothetical protein